ncbi:gallate dioxygenase [Paraburkholderia phymatum]|uniref:Protocatechuate 4,5-dioxygenase n=1 Tax=Paraburkholderia phymatum (strain DSM 17167 / CIP 108236 / LMG 21445 / STM815) TaxID=391038 RepID=B2JWT1_PARP8|nr:gallate dioxygenase [Paraburkholderia phymatum]ACC75408.1 Protocatechuate 4,5-dioxygenase [Paraburkholderia phymatum STM815]
MARIIGGIAASHTPTIGFAFDKNKRDDPVWAPIFENFAPLADWLAQKRPDVLLLIYNDHITSFFFDHYSAFALGVGQEWSVADEGGGPRDLPSIQGHPEFAAHVGKSLMTDEFDMSFFQNKPLDHGCFSPLSMLCPHQPEWPVKLVPLQMGVLQLPVPSARRFYKLGQALRRAVESYPEDLDVAIVATGGLSHQVHGERSGFNNTPWDHRFLDLLEQDPEQLAGMTLAEYAELGGYEGAEVIMWLTMRGALPANVVCKHRSYYLPSMAGIATAIYEGQGGDTRPAVVERHRERMAVELTNVEKLEGTYPFSIETAVKAYRINEYLHRMIEPAHREAFVADEEASFEAAGLSEQERDLLRRRDWRGLLHYGVIFFMLEKLGAVTGVANLHIYAAMRGQTLEAFQKTRNAPGALYSVAGKTAAKADWEDAEKAKDINKG